MGLPQRDGVYHTYADAHDQTVKLAADERAGVREVWIVHPGDRVLTICRRDGAKFGRPMISELNGQTAAAVPGLAIDWDRVLARLD